MFTGIVQEVGKVRSLSQKDSCGRLEINCDKVCKGVSLGDSVSVNGVCLSVVKFKNGLCFDVVGTTLRYSNLQRLRPGDPVNLENALKVGDALSGHFVSGHIDGVRTMKSSKKGSAGWVLDIKIKREDQKYIISKGSIAVDGVSLTIAEICEDSFRIAVIPHTFENTTIGVKRAGDYVNIEFDLMAKYSEKNSAQQGHFLKKRNRINSEMLQQKGFI
ncbi:MAG: riboflavin synthase [Candidatus Omnitrophota bacterium]